MWSGPLILCMTSYKEGHGVDGRFRVIQSLGKDTNTNSITFAAAFSMAKVLNPLKRAKDSQLTMEKSRRRPADKRGEQKDMDWAHIRSNTSCTCRPTKALLDGYSTFSWLELQNKTLDLHACYMIFWARSVIHKGGCFSEIQMAQNHLFLFYCL